MGHAPFTADKLGWWPINQAICLKKPDLISYVPAHKTALLPQAAASLARIKRRLTEQQASPQNAAC
ncbi:hypothetical protein C1H71_14195 [Iodobacter fluviatilis]|uniref:Uncharacterized protein n=1 Tax=Iodobacter fluviatilis TaxID=537 RepID=A0A7G3GC62_9NEIS|nr:hypothetical protein C1H71_14195 [Iodobacter fluviatilis]